MALNQEKADGVEVEELTAAKGVTLSEIAEKDNKLWLVGGARRVFFIFIFFENIFYRNIFSISQFTVLYPTARQGTAGGLRDLYINKNIFYLRGGLWWESAAPCRPSTGREGVPPGRGAAGSPSPQNCSNGPLDEVLDILDTNKNH